MPDTRIEISESNLATMTLADLVDVPPEYGGVEEIREWLAPKEQWRVATFFPFVGLQDKFWVAENAKVAINTIENMIYG